MTNFPTARQLAPAPAEPPAAHAACNEALAQAFSTFSQAAGSLETTYLALNDEVQLLRRELAGTRLHLEDILRCLPCGVIVADERGRLLRCNPAARLLLSRLPGWELAEPHDWNPLTKPRQVPAEFRSAGEMETDFEFAAKLPETTRLTYGICRSKVSRLSAKLTLSTSKYFSEQSAPSAASESAEAAADSGGEWVYILRDLTREKDLLREHEATRRLTSLAEVSAVLAHEIRNPLASLELFAGLIAKSAVPASDQSVWINHIRAGLRSLSGTVNNVLQLYSQSAPTPTPLDLRELLLQTCDFLQPLAEQWQVGIASQLPGAPCVVRGVAHQLQQVLLNVAMNAFRASPPGGRLDVALDTTGQAASQIARISITDDGPGIPAELIERIFEPGFSTRADSPGIGLAVSRRIIEQHGGALIAGNAPGRGARFIITVPLPAGASDYLTHSISHESPKQYSHEVMAITR